MAVQTAKGAVIQWDEATPDTFVTLAEVTKVQPPNPEASEIDATRLAPATNYMQKAVGLADPGTTECELLFDIADTEHEKLTGEIGSGNLHKWRIRLADATKNAFSGYVKSFGLGELTPDGMVTAKLVIQNEGAMTLAASA